MQDLNTYGYWAICRPTGDDVVLRVFLRQAICCSLYGGWAPLDWYELGWVWVDEMDPWTTLGYAINVFLGSMKRQIVT